MRPEDITELNENEDIKENDDETPETIESVVSSHTEYKIQENPKGEFLIIFQACIRTGSWIMLRT